MKKTDARVRYTIRVLKESLLSCLAERPINRITVKEVCDRAEVNRATFYTHFADCFDLLEAIETDLLDEFEKSLHYVDSPDVSALVEAIYDMIKNNETVCRVLVFGNTNSSLLRRMIDLARPGSLANWRRHLKGASDEDLEMLYTHLSNGLLHVVVEGYDRFEREKVIRFVDRTVKASLAAFS